MRGNRGLVIEADMRNASMGGSVTEGQNVEQDYSNVGGGLMATQEYTVDMQASYQEFEQHTEVSNMESLQKQIMNQVHMQANHECKYLNQKVSKQRLMIES